MARRPSATDNILSPIHDLLDEDNREVLATWTSKSSQKPSGTAPKRPSASGPTKRRRFDPTDPSTWTTPNTVVPSSTTANQSEDTAQNDSAQREGVVVQHDQVDGAVAVQQQEQLQDRAPQPSIRLQTPANTVDFSGGISRLTLAAPDEVYASEPAPLSPLSLQPTTAGLRPVEQTDRRFSNKSTSFSTVDSDGVGRLERDREVEEDAVQYSSDDEPYKTSGDETSPVAERGRARRSNRQRVEDADDTANTLVSPRIESMYVTVSLVQY